jgi:hypothetical protein
MNRVHVALPADDFLRRPFPTSRNSLEALLEFSGTKKLYYIF